MLFYALGTYKLFENILIGIMQHNIYCINRRANTLSIDRSFNLLKNPRNIIQNSHIPVVIILVDM